MHVATFDQLGFGGKVCLLGIRRLCNGEMYYVLI